MEPMLIALIIGLIAGVASGAFGIGGAVITAPLLRVLLDSSGHVAVGTTLPMVIPVALSGLYVFSKKNPLNWRVIFIVGLVGSIFSILGAYFTNSFTGTQLMFFIALLLLISALLIFSRVPRPLKSYRKDILRIGSIGALAGFVSGFLGVGGGGFLVPLFMIVLGLSIHEAIACSLGSILIYAIPGSITHFMLNHVDIDILIPILIFGVIGAQIGSRFVSGQDEDRTKTLIAGFYVLLGLILLANEHLLPGMA
ncbi:MAG: sulfite exporter TauE/SafE family protein [Candidatus Micrarchaeota archaeon]